VLEVNPKHPIIRSLAQASLAEGDKRVIAELVAAQVLDNALIAAGLIDDARSMLPRLNNILSASLK
jgi:HSP90 family molecular chaperone